MRSRVNKSALYLAIFLFMATACKKDEVPDLSNLVKVEITPQDLIIAIGTTLQYQAMGTFADGTTRDVTQDLTWFSSPSGMVTFPSPGLAQAVGTGDTYIVAGGGQGITAGSLLKVTTVADLDKEKVRQQYEDFYLTSELTDCGWTGNDTTCDPGTLSKTVQELVAQRINFFRRLVGIPTEIVLDSNKNKKCQHAALMVKANALINPTPPPTWTCWTQAGYDASGVSIMDLGTHSVNAVKTFMEDFGSNYTDVKRRRWLLYSKALVLGHGSTDNSCAVWVKGNDANPYPQGMPEYVAYPPEGPVPGPLVFARWSLSVPEADFSNAMVAMTDENNQPMTLTVVSNDVVGEGDNTLVWEPSGVNITGPDDTRYHVTVSNVVVNGNSKTYSYQVVIFQP